MFAVVALSQRIVLLRVLAFAYRIMILSGISVSTEVSKDDTCWLTVAAACTAAALCLRLARKHEQHFSLHLVFIFFPDTLAAKAGFGRHAAKNTGLCLGGFVSAVTKRQGRELVQEMPAPRCSALRVLVPEAAPRFSPAAGAAELEQFSPVSCMEQPPTASAVWCAGRPGSLSLFLLHIAILKVAMGHRIGKRVQAASRLISAYVIFSTWSSLS